MCLVIKHPPLPRLLFEQYSVHFLSNENARLTSPKTLPYYENSQPFQYFGTPAEPAQFPSTQAESSSPVQQSPERDRAGPLSARLSAARPSEVWT
jgi:hypothetical protein